MQRMIVHAAFVFFSSLSAALHTSQRAPPQHADAAAEFAAAMRQYTEEQDAIIAQALGRAAAAAGTSASSLMRLPEPRDVDEQTCIGKKFKYMPPPHCATTSISAALEISMKLMKNANQTHCSFGLNGHDHTRPVKDHQMGCCAKGMHGPNKGSRGPLGPAADTCLCLPMLSAIFIRDPWKRLLTCAGFIAVAGKGEALAGMTTRAAWRSAHTGQGGIFDGLTTRASKVSAFREFVQDDSKMERCKNWMHSQVDWVIPNQTHIFRISHVEEDFRRLCELIGIPKEYCSVPEHLHRVTNNVDEPTFSDYYNQDAIDTVARYWADDIAYFGFKFGESGERWGLAT